MSAVTDVRRADSRPHTEVGWLDSRHSFSLGRHYDPSNTRHGLLVVSNDDRIDPGYEQLDINGELDRGGVQPIASGGATTPPSRSASATPCCGAAA